MANSVAASVGPSGKTLILQFFDGSSNRTNLTSYSPLVSKVFRANGAAGTYTITINGHTTASIRIGAADSVIQTAVSAITGGSNFTVGATRYPFTIKSNDSSLFTASLDVTSLTTPATANPTTTGTTAEVDQDASGGGFALTGLWGSPGTGAGGVGASYTLASASGTGANVATYTFPTPAVGNYMLVMGTNGPVVGRAQSVPFRIHDGTGASAACYLGQFRVDQSTSKVWQTINGGAVGGQPITVLYASGSNSIVVTVSDDVLVGDIGKPVYISWMALVPVSFAVVSYTSPFLVSDKLTGDPNLVTTGSWRTQNFGGDFNGQHHYTLAGDPVSTLMWAWSGIPDGTYSFQTFYRADSGNRTAHASYQPAVGGTPVGSPIVIDQNVAASGGQTVTDNQPASFTFKPLGNIHVTGGQASLTLTSQTDNTTEAGAALLQLVSLDGYGETVSGTAVDFATGPVSIKVNGGSATPLTTSLYGNMDGLRPAKEEPYMGFILPSTILNTDSVTVSVSANTMNTAAGSVPGITNQAVANKVGSTICTVTPTASRTITSGYNLSIGDTAAWYCNYLKHIPGVNHVGSSPTPLPLNSDGMPQFVEFDSNWKLTFGVAATNPVDTKYPYYAPQSGTWTYKWDGGVIGEIEISGDAVSVVSFISFDSGHATDNTAVFSLTLVGGTSYSPAPNIVYMGGQITAASDDVGRMTYVGTWTTVAGSGWRGSYRHNSGVSTDTVTINYGALPAATYRFVPAWTANGANTANATYTVFENGVQIATATWNQQGGTGGLLITTAVGGGNITVVLHGDNAGLLVFDSLQCRLTSTLGAPLTPITRDRLYWPGVDTTGATEFHPTFLQQLKGATTLRSVTAVGNGVFCACQNPGDYTQESESSYTTSQARTLTWQITQIDNWSDPHGAMAASWFGQDTHSCLITVDDSVIGQAALRFVTGQQLSISIPAGVQQAGGSFVGAGIVYGGVSGTIEHDSGTMASNQFALRIGFGSAFANGQVPTFPATSLGTVQWQTGGIPLASYIRLVNKKNAENLAAGLPHCNAYFCTSVVATSACNRAIGAQFAAGLDPGIKLYVTLGDEQWNNFFPLYHSCAMLGAYAGVNGVGRMSGLMFSDFEFAFSAAGRLGDLQRCVSGQYTSAVSVSAPLAQLAADGKTVDCVEFGPYMSNFLTTEPDFAATYETLDNPIILDFYEAAIAFSGWLESNNAACQGIVAASAFPSAKLICYEGGLPDPSLGGTNDTIAKQAQSARYHPRIRASVNGFLSALNGVFDKFCYYDVAQPPVVEGGSTYSHVYGAYQAWNQLPGLGDGSDSLHDNRPDITGAPPTVPNQLTAVAPIPQALIDWNDSSSSSATTATLSGPSTGVLGVTSTNFTVALDGSYTGTITLTSSGSGTFSPTSLSGAGTFTYTALSNAGSPHLISISPSPTLATSGSPVSYTVTGSALVAGIVNPVATSTTTATVSATAVMGGVSTFTYQFQRAPDVAGSPGSFANVGSAQSGLGVGVAPTPLSETGLSVNTTYWYRYRATDSESTPVTVTSASASVTTPATMVSGVTSAIPTSSTRVRVSATAVTGGVPTFSYQYQRAPDSSGSPGTFANVGSARTGLGSGVAPSGYDDTGLTASTKYWYRVQSTDSSTSPVTVSSAAVSVTTPATGGSPAAFLVLFNSGGPMGSALNVGAEQVRLVVHSQLNQDLPANLITVTWIPFTLTSSGTQLAGTPVALVAANDGSVAAKSLPRNSYAPGLSKDNSSVGNLGGTVRIKVDLSGVTGPIFGTIDFFIQNSSDAFATDIPDAGQGYLLHTTSVNSPRVYNESANL